MSKDKSKYNSSSKSAEWFPFKKRIFDTTAHAVIKSKAKCSYKAEALLSFQENQMLEGVSTSLQTSTRDALRICIDELHLRGGRTGEDLSKYAKAVTKEQGHTSRSINLSVRITKQDLLRLEDIAEINYLSKKEAIRLVIIWMAKGIKDDSIEKLKGCSEVSQDERAKEWKSKQKEFKKSPSTQHLKEVREFWKDYYEEENEKREEENKLNRDERLAKMMGLQTYDDMIKDKFDDLLKDKELEANELDTDQRQVYFIMARYGVDYDFAVQWYKDDLAEMDAISKMTSYEFMQYMKKEKAEVEKIRRERDAQEKAAKDQERKKYLLDRGMDIKEYESMISFYLIHSL